MYIELICVERFNPQRNYCDPFIIDQIDVVPVVE